MSAVHNFDLAIEADFVLTMAGRDEKTSTLKNTVIGVNGSKISFVGPLERSQWTAKKTISAKNSVVIPGLINGHSHLPMTMFRGLSDDEPLQKWLYEHILPLEARLVSPEFVRLGTELALAESLLSGTTTIYDMYYFEDDTADVVDKVGARAVLGETVFDFAAPDNKDKSGGDYKILERLVEKYGRHERITPVITPHAPYTCSDETLKGAAAFAAKHKISLGIHVSETKAEVEASIKQFGKSPVRRLKDLGVMDVPCVFAHGVHLSADDIRDLKEKNTAVIYNPESNMKLGSGAAPIKALLDAGVAVGLGTDGAASNNDLNLFGEMSAGAKLQKLSSGDNSAITAWQLLQMATVQGARALGLSGLGKIEVGATADLTVVDLDHPHLWPLHSLASQLVYAANGSEVSNVIVHGKVLVEDRNLTTIDLASLKTRIADYRKRNEF